MREELEIRNLKMSRITLHIIFISLFFFSLGIKAQNPPGSYTSTNKKAIKYLEEGKMAFENKQDALAEKSLKKALEEDPNFVEAMLGLGSLYQATNRQELAIPYLKKAIVTNARYFPAVFYLLAQSQLLIGQYPDAKLNLETFLKIERINPNLKDKAEKFLVNATFGTEAMKKPVPYVLVNVGEGINSELNEYFPAVTADGNQFLFTRGLIVANMPGYENEDFFISKKVSNVWQPSKPINEINSVGNEGAPTLSADGNIMFFASCANETGDYGTQERKGYGSCDIFYSQKINGVWTKPRNCGPSVNTSHWETQPSFSSDGKSLYFIRGLRGRDGLKDQDIYVSNIEDGKFTLAVKISSNVNTPKKEESILF